MTYLVKWSATALSQLARIVAGRPDPDAVDRETVWMDSILRRYPLDVGESRFGSYRLWYADIPGVWYEVDDVAMKSR